MIHASIVGKHKVSAHEILEVVFELIDKDRTGPSTEMNWSRHAERATTTEDQFHNTNITEESKDGPQQSISSFKSYRIVLCTWHVHLNFD